MKALVTGANGFLGSHLVDRLLDEGHEVHVLIRKTSNLQWLLGKPIHSHYGDVTGDQKGLKEAIQNMDLLFHVAGIIRAKQAGTYYAVNAGGTARVLETCLKTNPGIKRIVVVTSLAAQGPSPDEHPLNEEGECHPITDYGKSKRDAELIALKYADRLPITIVRPPAIYGPRDDQVFRFFQMVRWGFALLPGWGRRSLNLCHVEDVVSGCLLAATSPKAVGQIFYIGEDKNYSWDEAAGAIGQAVHRKPLKLHMPGLVVYGLAAISELVGRLTGQMPPLNLDYARNFMQRNWALDTSKAQRLLGYRSAYPLKRGAEETARWYEDEGWF